MESNRFIKALTGTESLFLILPKEVYNKLNIADQEWLEFEIRNRNLVIKKIENIATSLETGFTNDPDLQSYSYGKNVSVDAAVSKESVNIA